MISLNLCNLTELNSWQQRVERWLPEDGENGVVTVKGHKVSVMQGK